MAPELKPASISALFLLGWLAAASDISKGPYIQASGTNTASVMWESASPADQPPIVRFGINRSLSQNAAAVSRQMNGVSTLQQTNVTAEKTNITSIRATNTFYLHEALLTHLRPGALYSYDVQFNGQRTPARQFRVLNPDASRARFVAYGDSRSFPAIHTAVANRFSKHKPDFILHTGDLVARGKDYGLWSREFFRPLANVIDRVPLFSVIGNHEEDGTNYLAYFHLPGKELWYSFDVGPVYVLALDYHFQGADTEQFRFAETDLINSSAPWKIVFLHYPVFNIGGHASGWGHTNYLPLFYAAKVDLVLAGHSHLYERFRPVTNPDDPERWPLTFITTGGGAASLHPSFDHPALLARKTTNHYILFEATATTLKGRTMTDRGREIDRFVLKKSAGRYPQSYLAQAYPQNSLKLVSEMSPLLNSQAHKLPHTNACSDVIISLKPRTKSIEPATLTLSLAPDSAAHYSLENGPLYLTTPPPGSTNRVAAEVRATGISPIRTTRGDELIPPLVFQASVYSDGHETIVYTSKARLSRQPSNLARNP